MTNTSDISAEAVPLYDSFAQYYDVWTAMAPGAKGDVEFYVSQAKLLPPGSTILELGVGTGRVAVEIALAGYSVIGIDLSRAMLDRAEQRAREAGVEGRLQLVQSDFTSWSPKEPVELVVCPYHTLGHVLDAGDRKTLFENVFGNLVSGGRFIFNLSGSEVFESAAQCTAEGRSEVQFTDFGELELSGNIAKVRTRTVLDPVTNISYTDVLGKIFRGEIAIVDASWTFTLAHIKEEEIRYLAKGEGFIVESLSGSFGAKTPPKREQVWTLRKP